MNGEKNNSIHPVIFVIIVAGILSIRFFSDELGANNMIIPVVVIVFVAAFGALGWQALKNWKKSDEEIVADYQDIVQYFKGTDSGDLNQKINRLLGAAMFVGIFLYNSRDNAGALPRYIFCGISILIFAIPVLQAWLVKKRGVKEDVASNHPEAVAAIIIGLIPCGFLCFFCVLGIIHGVWWFVLPPGLVFLLFLSRPLVAGLRILLQKPKDPGEKHLRKKEEPNPWDRPDKY